MMRYRFREILLGMIFLGFSMTAQCMELAVEGGLSMDSPSFQVLSGVNSFTFSSASGFALGAFVGIPFSTILELESGLMYMPRHFTYVDSTVPDVSVDVSFESLLFPVVMRVNAGPFLSVGAGPYYMMGVGQVGVTRTLAGVEGSTVPRDFNSAGGFKKTGFGLLGSVRFGFFMGPMIQAVVDARYLVDVSERYLDPSSSMKFRDLQVLAGLSFHI